MKYAIYKGEVGLFAVRYIDCKSELADYPYIKEEYLPVKVNRVGGYTTFSEEYEKDQGFLYIKDVSGDKEPLTREERFPKNSMVFYFGWIDRNGNTYACNYTNHTLAAEAICKELGYEGYNYQRTLEEYGWISVSQAVPYTPDNCLERDIYIAEPYKTTKKQVDKLSELDLLNTYGGRFLQALLFGGRK